MADDFIGLHMLVSLRDQPVQFKGTVSAIEAGPSSRLTLSNGPFPLSKPAMYHYGRFSR